VDENDGQDRSVAMAVADHPDAATRPAGRIGVEPDSVDVGDRFVGLLDGHFVAIPHVLRAVGPIDNRHDYDPTTTAGTMVGSPTS